MRAKTMLQRQNRLRTYIASLLLLSAFCGGAAEISLAAPPTQLTFLGVHNTDPVSVVMNNITYTSTNPSSLAGKGSLVFRFGSTNMPSIPNVPFQGVSVDNQGRAIGFTYTLTSELDFPDIFGSGVGLTLGSGTQIGFISTPTPSLTLSGGSLAAILPFRDSSGNSPKLQLQPQLTLAENGEVKLDAQNASLTADTAAQGLKLPGCVVLSSPMNLHYHHFPTNLNKPDEFTLSIPTAMVAVNLPDVVAQDESPLTLDATNISIDQDGMVSFTASLNNANLTIPLAQPMGFSITIHSASYSMQNSKPTAFGINCDLTLPAYFTTQPNGGGGSVTFPNVNLAYNFQQAQLEFPTEVARRAAPCDVSDNLFASIQLPNDIDICWNQFELKIPKNSTVVVDFSSTKGDNTEKDPTTGQPLPASWRGIVVTQANLVLPPLFNDKNGNSSTISAQNFMIDQNGVSGSISGSNLQLPLLGVSGATVNHLEITLGHNRLQDCELAATLPLQNLNTRLDLKGSLAASGAVSLAVVSTTIPCNTFHCSLNIDQSKVDFQPGQSFDIQLTGQIQFDSNAPDPFQGASLDVSNLDIGSDGSFKLAGGWLNLKNSFNLSLGPAQLDIRQVGFGEDNNHGPWIGITGDVSLSGDLPIGVQGKFGGIQLYKDGTVNLGSVGVDCEIKHLIHVTGDINFHQPDNHIKEKYIQGDVTLTLECIGGGTGFSANFLVAPHAWYVGAGVTLPQPIALGSSGLALGGFFGGVGHNVKLVEDDNNGWVYGPSSTDPGAKLPTKYDLVPDDQAIQSGNSSWIFSAGVRLETDDKFTFWGDFSLTVTINPLTVDLHGNGYLLDAVDNQIPADPSKHDRVVIGDIYVNPEKATFQASLAADLHFPSRSTDVLDASGQIVLHIDPNTQYLHIGGPIHPDSNGYLSSIDNPIEVHLNILGSPYTRAAFDVDHANGQFAIAAALQCGWGFSDSGSFGPASWSVSANAKLAVLFSFRVVSNGFQAQGSLMISANAHFSLSVDFGILGSADMGLDMGVSGGIAGTLTNTGFSADGYLQAYINVHIIKDISGSVNVHVHI